MGSTFSVEEEGAQLDGASGASTTSSQGQEKVWRHLAVGCDKCGKIIKPGEQFLPVRDSFSQDVDLCLLCSKDFSSLKPHGADSGQVNVLAANSPPSPLAYGFLGTADNSEEALEMLYSTKNPASIKRKTVRDSIFQGFHAYARRPFLGVMCPVPASSGKGKNKIEQNNISGQKAIKFCAYGEAFRRTQYVRNGIESLLLMEPTARSAVVLPDLRGMQDATFWFLACILSAIPVVVPSNQRTRKDTEVAFELVTQARVKFLLTTADQLFTFVTAIAAALATGANHLHDIAIIGDNQTLSDAVAPMVEKSLMEPLAELGVHGVEPEIEVRRSSDSQAVLEITVYPPRMDQLAQSGLAGSTTRSRGSQARKKVQLCLHSMDDLVQVGKQNLGENWMNWGPQGSKEDDSGRGTSILIHRNDGLEPQAKNSGNWWSQVLFDSHEMAYDDAMLMEQVNRLGVSAIQPQASMMCDPITGFGQLVMLLNTMISGGRVVVCTAENLGDALAKVQPSALGIPEHCWTSMYQAFQSDMKVVLSLGRTEGPEHWQSFRRKNFTHRIRKIAVVDGIPVHEQCKEFLHRCFQSKLVDLTGDSSAETHTSEH